MRVFIWGSPFHETTVHFESTGLRLHAERQITIRAESAFPQKDLVRARVNEKVLIMSDTPPCFQPNARGTFVAAALDTETTGLSSETDHIIEIGIRLFQFDMPSGRMVAVLEDFSALQDPGFVISPEIQSVTGISPEILVGQKIDWSRVDALLSKAEVLIAHNAMFDRGFIDLKSRVTPSKVWACSAWQVEWRAKGFKNARLQDVCGALGIVYQAHRAMSDVEAMMQLIGRVDESTGETYLREILTSAGQQAAFLWAEGRTYDQRDLLKANGFRWNPGAKTWGKTVLLAEVPRQVESVKSLIPGVTLQSRPLGLQDRHKSVL